MNADSPLEERLRICIELPNGTRATVAIPLSELKRILAAFGEREHLYARTVEMFLLILGLEET